MLLFLWLLFPMAVMAQRDVVMTVSYAGISSYLYHIGFNISLFTEFHKCISKGADSCVVIYEEQYCPNCIVETVRPSGQNNLELNNYYRCSSNLSVRSINCHRQTAISTTSPLTESYLLRNSPYASICFGFVWNLVTEGITFNSSHWDVEFCGANCDCPSRRTTTQSGTTFSLSPPTAFLSSTHATSSSSRSPVTAQETSPPKLPTKPITAVPTADTSIHSTESSSGTDNSSDDTPISAVVGSVLGVIIIILIVVVIVLVWRRRASPKSSGNTGPGEQRVLDFPSSHIQTNNASSGDAVRNKKENGGKSPSYMNTVLSENTYEVPNDGVKNVIQYENVL